MGGIWPENALDFSQEIAMKRSILWVAALVVLPGGALLGQSLVDAWSAAKSTKRPNSSFAINAKDFPGNPPFFQKTLASFFQKNKSSATHDTSFS
jgi:hypothetical protein